MSKPFPKGRPDHAPTAGGLDELMENPPEGNVGGSLAAYAEGSRMRRKVYLGLALGTAAAIAGGTWYARRAQYERDNPTAHYTVARGAQDEIRPRRLEWNDGFARLALSRAPPGIDEVVLPDRVIHLADGVDTAQFKVNVVGGKTIELKVLTGDIQVEER